MHEVHRPALIDRLGHRQCFGLLAHDPLSWLDAQIELELAIDPIHPLVIPAVALHVSQIQTAQAKAPVALVVGQADQVIGGLGILGRALRLVAVAGFADPERCTRHAYARTALLHGLLSHLAGEMASPLFFEGLLHDLRLQPLFCIHLLEPSVLRFELLEPRQERRIHATKLGPPLVERRRADAVLPTQLRNRLASLRLLEHGDDLAV